MAPNTEAPPRSGDSKLKRSLLDVRMPDINGVAAFDQMVRRELTQRLPVIS